MKETPKNTDMHLLTVTENRTVPNQRNLSAQKSLDKLAFRFFKLFAQYESTMKERDFFNVNKHGQIFVDWDRFANEIAGGNFRDYLGKHASAADYILQYPPKKQAVNTEGKIIWEEVPNNDKSVQMLFGHICRVRNNLFHGAKFNGTWFDPKRSKLLLENSLLVLEHYRTWLGH